MTISSLVSLIYFIIKLNTVFNLGKTLRKKNQSNVGRPGVSAGQKKDSHIFVNLTAKQKESLKKIADTESRSLSQLCVHALKKAGYL